MEILQARMLEWVAKPSSRGSSRHRGRTCISCGSCGADGFFTTESPRKPRVSNASIQKKLECIQVLLWKGQRKSPWHTCLTMPNTCPAKLIFTTTDRGFLVVQTVKNLLVMQETLVWSLGQEDPLEKGMATHSNILAQRILWTEESGGLQSMGLQRVGHDWVTNTDTNTTCHLQVYWICWTSLTVGQVETDFLITSLYILRWNVNYSTGAILWQVWNSLAISFSPSLYWQYQGLLWLLSYSWWVLTCWGILHLLVIIIEEHSRKLFSLRLFI